MYIIPGYIEYYEEGGALLLSSKLLQNKIKITDPGLQEEFYSIVRCGGCPALSTPLTHFLYEQEMLASREEIARALDQLRQLMQSELLLTMMPTEGCNFRCPYCYETHAPVTMRREILDQIQAYLIAQVPHFRTVQVSWFGGEPTLCKDIVLETCALVQAAQAEHGFQYNGGMTTNGYLLDAAEFRQYYAAGITEYQITLDGWNHDQTRPHVSGRGTLRTILHNLTEIAALPKEEFRFRVVLRHNILAGDTDFSWYDHLAKLFGADDRFFVYVSPVGDWGGEDVQALNLLKGKQAKELVSQHIAYLDHIGLQHTNQIQGIFSGICYASYPHSMVFRADGKIEKCTVALDHPKNLLGWVDPERGVVLDGEINRLWSVSDLRPECNTCADVLSCLNMRCKKGVIIDGNACGTCPHMNTQSG